jgi:predicted lipid-binding transport protein (Tim44 family)
MRKAARWMVMLLLVIAPISSWARGGGGCLAEGTLVKTPTGWVAIERLKAGDSVWSVIRGNLQRAQVQTLTAVQPEALMEIATGEEKIEVTPEHPVMVAPGEYRLAGWLREGDTIFVAREGNIDPTLIQSVKRNRTRRPAYNLLVSPGGTFITEGFVVHNKGCFLPDSQILKADGKELPISALQRGDDLLAFTHEGRMVRTKVREVLRLQVDEYFLLKTDRALLRVTAEHPFYVGKGTYKTVEALKEGDAVFAWDGQWLSEQRIVSLQLVRNRVEVFNLQTDRPNTFFAGGLAVHNKGGSSSSSRSSSSSSSSSRSSSGSGGGSAGDWFVFVFLGIWITVFIVIFVVVWKNRGSKKNQNLDFVYGRNHIAPKAGKTERLLTFLSQQDPAISSAALLKVTDSTFCLLQERWQARNYEPMKPLMMPDLFNQHVAQLQGMVRNHEINRIESLKVEQIDLVNVRYTEKPDQRQFTALITASARDYYVDDRTGKFLRGDKGSARFQEFWTFHHMGGQWLLLEIEQAGESDILKEENVAEMLTDDTIKGIYGDAARQKGEAGPWLEKETGEKADRIERMLNFLVQTDKLWTRNQMLERARQVFMGVHLAKESGDLQQIPAADLFPAVTEHLRAQLQQWQKDGLKVEYRNLCVRKAELILVRNFADNSKDEFMVRISAHAQRVFREKDRVISQQEDVTSFEEYWIFGRLDHQWKLKEVLPPGQGKKKITEENVDEESGPGQMQWYYRQSRAM